MFNNSDFVRLSLETNLFFARIMREHAIFIAASLPCKDIPLIQQASFFKDSFTLLLTETLNLANGQISQKSITGNIYVTPQTIPSEQAVQKLTGIPIDTRVTLAETILQGSRQANPALANTLYALNQTALVSVTNFIKYKESLINHVSACSLFTWVFPSMLDHVKHEAMLYFNMLTRLQKGLPPLDKSMASEIEGFWDHIMEDHAQYIRNYLDPTEKALSKKAEEFSEEFERLAKETLASKNNIPALKVLTRLNREATIAIRDFKVQGTELILACKIKSLINPLLSDHTAREANYYIQILDDMQKFL